MSGHGMVMMYGTPPMGPSPRIPKPIKPMEPGKVGIGPLVEPMPGVQAMPPVTHNPFTGEPVNVLEMLARNAFLEDQNARLRKQMEDRVNELGKICDSRYDEIQQLKQQGCIDRGTIHTLETRCKGLEFQAEQAKAKLERVKKRKK